jgi:DNA-directed RNA polymerase specialized sigma24 family protein
MSHLKKKHAEFAEAYGEYYSAVYAAVYAKVGGTDVADDLVQEVFTRFLRIWKK